MRRKLNNNSLIGFSGITFTNDLYFKMRYNYKYKIKLIEKNYEK